MFNRKYIFIQGPFSISMLDYRSVLLFVSLVSDYTETHADKTKVKPSVARARQRQGPVTGHHKNKAFTFQMVLLHDAILVDVWI